MSMNLAFYTYFYGSERNGAFKIPTIPSLKYKCFYYTNNLSLLFLLKKTKWIPIYDNKKTNDDIIQSNMMGKYIKTCPHMFPHLKEFDYLCYLDSKLEHVSETFVEDYIRKYFLANTNTNTNTNYALILRNHTFIKPNVWEEYSVSMEQHRYKIQSDTYKKYINSQVDSGLKTETPYHCQCGFLIRNIQMCGIQDQISFFFVKQLFSDYILPFKQIPFVPKTHDTFVLENSIFNVLSKKYKSPSMKMTINS
jgi:hypothetical protein